VPTWFRYLLFQIPGWLIAAIILFGLWQWQFMPGWLAVVGCLAWLVKDLLLYPMTRIAYETRHKEGAQALIGERGVSEGDLSPKGWIRVRGELWRAVAEVSAGTIASGSDVDITAADGMVLFVRPVDKNHTRRGAPPGRNGAK
jgi:membrane-bound serine protease (ClpP class)